MARRPHYLLFSESARTEPAGCDNSQWRMGDRWRFVLESVDREHRLSASDREPDTHGERLELLAVVRGLEALEQPSRVTLITKSRYVSRGLSSGLNEWRESGWRWERFGQMVLVKDHDLWQRIDRAMQFHELECRRWRFDLTESADEVSRAAEPTIAGPHFRAKRRRQDSATGTIRRSLAGLGQMLRPEMPMAGAG